LKYYLRGLGIGIAVTAIILGAGRGKETLSDAEIKQRAAQLGMVEQSGLLSEREEPAKEPEADKEPVETEEPEVTPEPEEIEEPTEEPEVTPEPEEIKEPTAEPTEAPTKEPTPEPTEESSVEPTIEPEDAKETEEPDLSAEWCIISVNPGDGSLTVCKRLEEAGLITSATAYDSYMNEKGYDKKLQVGTFKIPKGTEPEEIALILMKKR
ncbi:MAG: hypothetical protein IKY23_04720, partial [Lachnospiraceae bacterium]|nr:hypothetical protein [Lachnospiraceae bacterium]